MALAEGIELSVPVYFPNYAPVLDLNSKSFRYSRALWACYVGAVRRVNAVICQQDEHWDVLSPQHPWDLHPWPQLASQLLWIIRSV
jgi:hypothetical protein